MNTAQEDRVGRPSPGSRRPPPTTKGPARIVAILPRGEAIRNFVYSGALDQAARDAELTVLSVIPNEGIRSTLRSRYPDLVTLAPVPEAWITRALRELLDMAHGRWVWSVSARRRWRLRDTEAIGIAAAVKRVAKKGACYPFASRTGLRILSRVERQASRWFAPPSDYVRLFRELQPTLVFNGSHVHSSVAVPAVQAAQWLGIPTAAFIFSWDNLTSQGRVIPPYDYYLVWNRGIRDQLLDMYRPLDPARVFVTGTPQFDFHFRSDLRRSREDLCQQVGADPRRPIVLYTTGMPNHMPGEQRIVAGIADMLAQMGDLGSPQLLVRIYPKDRSGRFEDLRRARPDILFPPIPWEPNWLTPTPEDTGLLTNMLRHAAVGINVASTVSLELCMFDRPVINVCYNPPGLDIAPIDYPLYYEFDHYRPIVESRAVTLARSEPEMSRCIRSALHAPQEHAQRRRALLATMFDDTLDGQSSSRVAAVLCRLAGAERSRG